MPSRDSRIAPTSAGLLARLAGVVLLALLLGAGAGFLAFRAGHQVAVSPRPSFHLLFIGNSYTSTNDLPGMIASLATAGGHPVSATMAAEGGWTLAQHAGAPETAALLGQHRWDMVVLQEQSQFPASATARIQGMYPAVRRLAQAIAASGATPILYLTWGRKEGWPEAGLPDFDAMQDQVTRGYLGIADELNLAVAPVGEAWRLAHATAPSLELWQTDGSHPTVQGTYLAACVFYAALFRQSPQGIPYTAGLDDGTARTLQTLAATVALSDPARWHLH